MLWFRIRSLVRDTFCAFCSPYFLLAGLALAELAASHWCLLAAKCLAYLWLWATYLHRAR